VNEELGDYAWKRRIGSFGGYAFEFSCEGLSASIFMLSWFIVELLVGTSTIDF
jgi:hypothetical protein